MKVEFGNEETKKVLANSYSKINNYTFLIITWFILAPTSSSIFGESVQVSFHLFTYVGLTLLFGLIVTCTLFIIQKLNEVISTIKQAKCNIYLLHLFILLC